MKQLLIVLCSNITKDHSYAGIWNNAIRLLIVAFNFAVIARML